MNKISSALLDLLERQEAILASTLKSRRRTTLEIVILGVVVLVATGAGMPVWTGQYPEYQVAGAPIAAIIIFVLARAFYVRGKSIMLNQQLRNLSSVLGPVRMLLEDVDLGDADIQEIRDRLSAISEMYERNRRK